MKKNNNPQKRHPSKKKNPAWKIVLSVVVVTIIALIAVSASFLKFYKPSVDTGVPFPTGGKPIPAVTLPTDEATADTPDDSNQYKRDTENVNFLIVGRDAASWNTDVIMIVNFNMRSGSLAVIQLPRDTYIETSGSRGRINTLFKTMRSEIGRASCRERV